MATAPDTECCRRPDEIGRNDDWLHPGQSLPDEGVVNMFWGDFSLDAIKEPGRWKIRKQTINPPSFLRIEDADLFASAAP